MRNKHKKGMELPISMTVTLILAIIVFIFGLTLIYKMYQAKNIGQEIDQRIQDEITSTFREGNELVAMPQNSAKTTPGQKTTFVIGIRNIENTQNFNIIIGFDEAYTPDEQSINQQYLDQQYIENDWLGNFKKPPAITIKKDQFQIIPITIKTGSNTNTNQQTQKGTYVFNVCIFKTQDNPAQTTCTKNDMISTYNKKIQQINIIV